MAIDFNQKGMQKAATISPLPPADQPKRAIRMDMSRLFGKRVKPWEVTFFASQLSLMLDIETPLPGALKALADETKNPALKEVVTALYQDIEEGRQLSDAMRRHPRVFNAKFVSMVKAGETGGFLNKILDRIVEMQEKRQALVTQLKSTLTYPAVLCVLGTLVVVYVLVGVLPQFAAFFRGKESILPWTTRFLMLTSDSLRHYWWVYILSTAGLVMGSISWGKSQQGRALRDRFFIGGPLISGLTNKIYTCDMLRTLGNLMESQVPLLEALDVTGPTIWNQYYRRFVEEIRDTVAQGGRFAQAFATYPYIPQTVKQMVAVGEEVGKIPVVMLRLAKFYDMEIEQELKKLSAKIEPAALVVMGSVVALIVSAVILPIFKLSQALH
jgi:type II secretory pathway component PulF